MLPGIVISEDCEIAYILRCRRARETINRGVISGGDVFFITRSTSCHRHHRHRCLPRPWFLQQIGHVFRCRRTFLSRVSESGDDRHQPFRWACSSILRAAVTVASSTFNALCYAGFGAAMVGGGGKADIVYGFRSKYSKRIVT